MRRQELWNQGSEPLEGKNHVGDLSSDYLNIKQIAQHLGIKASSLYSMAKQRRIPHYRIGRLIKFKKTEVDLWMEGQRQGVVDVRVEAKKILKFFQKKADLDVDRIVKKTVEEVKGKRYTPHYGKSDRKSGGLRKEAEHGSL